MESTENTEQKSRITVDDLNIDILPVVYEIIRRLEIYFYNIYLKLCVNYK